MEISSLTKNFTALIPGTTVEILDQDSKNVIQLIVNAYNVSRLLWFTVGMSACCSCVRDGMHIRWEGWGSKCPAGGAAADIYHSIALSFTPIYHFILFLLCFIIVVSLCSFTPIYHSILSLVCFIKVLSVCFITRLLYQSSIILLLFYHHL